MDPVIEGPVLFLGDNIDTDQVIPGPYLRTLDYNEMASHVFEGVSDNLSEAGVFFTSGERLRVTVEIDEPDGGRRVLSGHLVRVQRMSADSTGYAIEFERD